jgi:imidazolonepropionase-like amidohydrolase
MTSRFVLIPWVAAAMLVHQPAGSRAVQVFTGFTLIDPATARETPNAVLVVRNGRVEAVGRKESIAVPTDGAQTTDLAGKYVVPGFISSHVHISDVQGTGPRAYTSENTLRQLGVFARYGITTVLSLGGEEEPAFRARDTQDTPSLDRARIALAGPVVTARTADEARAAVSRVAALKPDIIKIRVDDNLGTTPKMPPEAYRAVIEEAHNRGLRVAAHVFYLDDAKDLLRAGADMIAHSVRDKDVDEEFIALMKQRNVPYCPTLTRELSTFVYESKPAFFADRFFLREADPAVVAQLQEPSRQQAMRESKSAHAYKGALRVAERNLKRAADAGLLIVLGTDAGPSAERFEGYFEHVEMAMMVQAGLTPAQVLKAATVDAARGLHRTDVGRLANGAWADFVVLDRSPLTGITNTRSIASVRIAGNEVPGAKVSATR